MRRLFRFCSTQRNVTHLKHETIVLHNNDKCVSILCCYHSIRQCVHHKTRRKKIEKKKRNTFTFHIIFFLTFIDSFVDFGTSKIIDTIQPLVDGNRNKIAFLLIPPFNFLSTCLHQRPLL